MVDFPAPMLPSMDTMKGELLEDILFEGLMGMGELVESMR